MFLKMLANAALLLVAYTEDEKPWLIVSTFVALLVFPEIIFLMVGFCLLYNSVFRRALVISDWSRE